MILMEFAVGVKLTILSSFRLIDVEQISQACHYINLQPLWAKENLSKGAKII